MGPRPGRWRWILTFLRKYKTNSIQIQYTYKWKYIMNMKQIQRLNDWNTILEKMRPRPRRLKWILNSLREYKTNSIQIKFEKPCTKSQWEKEKNWKGWCREARMKMDPAKSGPSSSSGLHYPALARMGGSLKPIQNTDPKMQNAPRPIWTWGSWGVHFEKYPHQLCHQMPKCFLVSY